MLLCIMHDLVFTMYLPAFNERLADVPKLIVSATGDQFFLLDDSHYYFQDLLGDRNYMQYVYN